MSERDPHSRLPLLYFSLAHVCLAAAVKLHYLLALFTVVDRPVLVAAGAAALFAAVVLGAIGSLLLARRAGQA